MNGFRAKHIYHRLSMKQPGFHSFFRAWGTLTLYVKVQLCIPMSEFSQTWLTNPTLGWWHHSDWGTYTYLSDLVVMHIPLWTQLNCCRKSLDMWEHVILSKTHCWLQKWIKWQTTPFMVTFKPHFGTPPYFIKTQFIVPPLKHMSYGQYSWLITINRG